MDISNLNELSLKHIANDGILLIAFSLRDPEVSQITVHFSLERIWLIEQVAELTRKHLGFLKAVLLPPLEIIVVRGAVFVQVLKILCQLFDGLEVHDVDIRTRNRQFRIISATQHNGNNI